MGKKLKLKVDNPEFKDGSKFGWNEKTNTGWKVEGGSLIQYKNGKATGATRNIKDQGDYYHDPVTGQDWRWHSGYGTYVKSYGAAPGQFITRPIRNTLKAIRKGYQNNPGVLGILDPRVWSAMQKVRDENIKKNKLKGTYELLETKRGQGDEYKPEYKKNRLYISPEGHEYNLDNLKPRFGSEYYVNNKGELKIRYKNEIDQYNKDMAEKEAEEIESKKSWAIKLSESFDSGPSTGIDPFTTHPKNWLQK